MNRPVFFFENGWELTKEMQRCSESIVRVHFTLGYHDEYSLPEQKKAEMLHDNWYALSQKKNMKVDEKR